MNKVILGNNKEVLKTFADNSIDSIVTDPPYELGFMGKKWDSTGIAYDVELWQECIRVLKPGGHLLAFSGTRTYHRMAVAIEDAGFEVRDMIEWVYGSGFPKSLNIGKAVDKLQGNEREDLGNYIAPDGKERTRGEVVNTYGHGLSVGVKDKNTKGSSPYEGLGTALKPSHEPICMARKPLSEKNVALNVLKWGTGGIDIDGSRVGITEQDKYDLEQRGISKGSGVETNINFTGRNLDLKHGVQELGRFPSNLIHDNSDEVKACFPETGNSARPNSVGKIYESILNANIYNKYNPVEHNSLHNDSGNASRFFKSIIYQAKASKSERGDGNNHPTVKPVALMAYLIKMVTPKGGVVLDPFAGSGSTLVAAKEEGFEYIGIDITPEYIEIINARLAAVTPQQKLF